MGGLVGGIRIRSKLGLMALIAIAVVVAQIGVSEAKYRGIHKLCLTASYRKVCTDIVNGASTWKEALDSVFNATDGLATRFQTTGMEYVKAAVANAPKPIQDKAIKVCGDDFDSMADYLVDVAYSLKHNDTYNAASTMSAAYRTHDCIDGFQNQWNIPLPPFLRRMFRLWEAYTLSCLTLLQL